MKISVSTWSFGGYLSQLGIYGVIDKAAEFGFEGIEFVRGGWSDSVSLEELNKIGEYARSKGLETVAFCTQADFINGSNGDIAAEIAQVKDQVDRAAALGVNNMRHDVASRPTDRKYKIGYDDCLPQIADAIREIAEYAQSKGIGTMTENHGRFSQDAERVEKLINTVAHPNFGALIDIGNFMVIDEQPWVSTGILAPYAKHVHAKDFFLKSGKEPYPGKPWSITRSGNYVRATIIGHGDARVYQSLRVLKAADYDGWISVEFEGIEDKFFGISNSLENLRCFIASV